MKESVEKIYRGEQLDLYGWDGSTFRVTMKAIIEEEASDGFFVYYDSHDNRKYVSAGRVKEIKEKVEAGCGCITLEEKEIIFAAIERIWHYTE